MNVSEALILIKKHFNFFENLPEDMQSEISKESLYEYLLTKLENDEDSISTFINLIFDENEEDRNNISTARFLEKYKQLLKILDDIPEDDCQENVKKNQFNNQFNFMKRNERNENVNFFNELELPQNENYLRAKKLLQKLQRKEDDKNELVKPLNRCYAKNILLDLDREDTKKYYNDKNFSIVKGKNTNINSLNYSNSNKDFNQIFYDKMGMQPTRNPKLNEFIKENELIKNYPNSIEDTYIKRKLNKKKFIEEQSIDSQFDFFKNNLLRKKNNKIYDKRFSYTYSTNSINKKFDEILSEINKPNEEYYTNLNDFSGAQAQSYTVYQKNNIPNQSLGFNSNFLTLRDIRDYKNSINNPNDPNEIYDLLGKYRNIHSLKNLKQQLSKRNNPNPQTAKEYLQEIHREKSNTLESKIALFNSKMTLKKLPDFQYDKGKNEFYNFDEKINEFETQEKSGPKSQTLEDDDINIDNIDEDFRQIKANDFED